MYNKFMYNKNLRKLVLLHASRKWASWMSEATARKSCQSINQEILAIGSFKETQRQIEKEIAIGATWPSQMKTADI